MGWLEPISIAVTAASLAKEFIDSSSMVKKYAKRIVYRIKHGEAQIPIFGVGGVGKTTLARIITDKDPLGISAPYDESWLIEPVKLEGDVPGELLVAPGQVERVERHWPELFEKIVTGECFGLINIVSFGYHSFSVESYSKHEMYHTGMPAEAFMEVYTKDRQKLELLMLRKVIDSLSAVRTPLWFVTIVNKQDLWWDRRDEVKKHYTEGEYASILQEFTSSIGGRSLQHEFLPVSLKLGNWMTVSGELLAPTIGGYDQAMHLRYMQSMFHKLGTLIEQGKPK